MTTLLICKTKDKIYLASDKRSSWGISRTRIYSKIIKKNDDLYFAASGESYLTQIFKDLKLPERNDNQDNYNYLLDIINSLRNYCKDNDIVEVNNSKVDNGSVAFIVFKKIVYIMDSNFCIYEVIEDKDAAGSGGYFALGYIEDREINKYNMTRAIEAAIKYDKNSGDGVDVEEINL